MRKILFLMAMLVCSLQFAMAGDVVTRDVNKLPVAAREMIGKHFSQTKVAYIKIEKTAAVLCLQNLGSKRTALPRGAAMHHDVVDFSHKIS